MDTHNPKQNIDQLQAILSNPAKKFGFLFGAGISMKDGKGDDLIPGIVEMTGEVLKVYTEKNEKAAVKAIKNELENEEVDMNIESFLSKISEKERAVGSERLSGLDAKGLTSLRDKAESKIKEMVSVHVGAGGELDKDLAERNIGHYEFARWIKNADRDSSVEIFTTNYDYLLELALEEYKIPYFDGFVGNYNAFFYPEWIEVDTSTREWVKLWKLHGSLGWKKEGDGIIRTARNDNSAIIYPSFLKYDHSRKQPYLSYMDRLSRFVRQEDSVLFVCGHSFMDQHINDTILTALSSARSSSIFILKYDELQREDSLFKDMALKNSRISIYAKRQAVIGSKFGEWKLDSSQETTPYFQDDHSGEEWNGKGDFLLGDFAHFVKFLSNFNSKPLT